jgi:surface antigen
MKKIPHHLGRFATFFKESSLVVQLVIVASGIGIVAGTATVAAMVATPNNDTTTTSSSTPSEDKGTVADTESKQSAGNSDQQATDTSKPQTSQTKQQSSTAQNTTPSSTSSPSQPKTQPQAPAQPTYADTYPFKADCSSSPQSTSTQIDPLSYTKCFSASYTANKVNQTFGTMSQYWGDPKNWPQAADNAHISRDTTPKLHSVGIQTTGGAGWSVWVEAVHDDNTIDISYYNFNNSLAYGTQYNVNPSVFSTYIYFGE